jgi:hypothetical protein
MEGVKVAGCTWRIFARDSQKILQAIELLLTRVKDRSVPGSCAGVTDEYQDCALKMK